MIRFNCEKEKMRFLKAYDCYDNNARDSLAAVTHLMPISDFPAYPTTPDNAVIFATTGMDGAHYCMVEDGDKMNIYIVEPCGVVPDRVCLIGHSISEMLSYGLAIMPMLFSDVFDLEKDEFLKELKHARYEWMREINSKRFKDDLNALEKIYPIKEFSASEVYDILRAMNGR